MRGVGSWCYIGLNPCIHFTIFDYSIKIKHAQTQRPRRLYSDHRHGCCAGILGIRADAAQNKAVKHSRLGILDCRYGLWMFKCRDPRRKALKLGLGAALLLSLAHVLTNLLGGCMRVCCRGEFRRAYSSRKLSFTCLVFVWILLAVGLSMLVLGMSSYGFKPRSYGFRQHHFLSIGGGLCFVHGIVAGVYYVSYTASTGENNK